MWKGGVFAFEMTSTSSTMISIFPVPCFNIMVDPRLTPLRNRTFHIYNEFTADIFCDIQSFLGYFRIKNDLNGTAAVTQIDENQSAQIASSLNPAGQMDRFVYAF